MDSFDVKKEIDVILNIEDFNKEGLYILIINI